MRFLVASTFVVGMLELDKATGRLAANSVKRGPLGDWWRQGVKRVRIVE